MSNTKNRFNANHNNEFFIELRKRVAQHFEQTNTDRYGNGKMVLKTIFMFALFFTPYLLLLSGIITNPLVMIGMWMLIAFGKAGIGLSIMHDANHGSYSKRGWVNRFLGQTMNLVGSNAEIWKLQHNRLHHTFTNIEGADEDINAPGFLRFSPNKQHKNIHKFQFLYVWFFYGISTLNWITAKDFIQIARYKRTGLITAKKYKKILWETILWKVIYFSYMLVLPLIFIPASAWFIVLGFFIMHFTTGLLLSIIFQTAHVMPDCQFPMPDETGEMETNWAIHEMLTTTNFAPSSILFSWFIGGLNYQVEHHLFPSICHVHYKDISIIVAETAREYGVPYNTKRTFISALWDHTKLLYTLGRVQPIKIKA